MRALGAPPGSVSPFAVINDRKAEVQIVLDKAVMDAEIVNAHPLTNTMTTTIKPEDLRRFIEACGHQPRVVDLKAAEPS